MDKTITEIASLSPGEFKKALGKTISPPSMDSLSSNMPGTNTFFTFTNLITALVIIVILGLLGVSISSYLEIDFNNIGDLIRQFINKGDQIADLSVDILTNPLDVDTIIKKEEEILDLNKNINTAKPQSLNIKPNSQEFNSKKRFSDLKSGYCYVGKDRGHRSCIKIDENNTCMSGDIFPSNEICVNPTLRV